MADVADRKYRPWYPVTVSKSNDAPTDNREIRKCDAFALHALAHGTASEAQQKMALAAILHICGTNDMDWMPEEHGGERETSFAAGKRHIGLQLRKLTSISLSILTGEANERPSHDRRSGKPADNRNADRAKQ